MGDKGIRLTGRLVFGAVVMVLGVLFTLDNLDLVDAGAIIDWWPTLLIAYGLMRLSGVGADRLVARGAFFTLLGSWWLLKNLGFIGFGLGEMWPLIMIAVGFALITGAMRMNIGLSGPWFGRPARDSNDDSTISAFALWSGTGRKVVSKEFRGGDVTAIMGGHEIDLRGAAPPANGRVELDLFVWWGGVDLRIPEDWKVSLEGVVLMGGVEDHSRAPVGEPRGHLILKGLVVMGGVEVKN